MAALTMIFHRNHTLMVMAAAVAMALSIPTCCVAQSATGVYTTYNEYNPSASGYSLSGLYCDTYDGSQPYSWRSQYYWTAFCGPAGGPMGPSLCGQCLQVSNPSTGQSVKVRILDRCSNGGLDLETNAFNAIDANRAGYNAGHLYTNYQFVGC